MLTNVEEQVILYNFGRNRLIVSIDGYDETSMMDRFRKYRGRPILINGPDASARLNVINA